MSKYDWSNVPKEVKWITTTPMGNVLGFGLKPDHVGDHFYKSSSLDFVVELKIRHYTGYYGDSLEERPDVD